MSARLVLRRSDGSVQDVPLLPPMRIGSGKEVDLRINNDQVSGIHARLTVEEGSFFIEDHQSTNGTFVNGTRISRVSLRHFDVISVAPGVTLIFLTTQPGSARVETAESHGVSSSQGVATIAGGQVVVPGRLPNFAATMHGPLADLTPPLPMPAVPGPAPTMAPPLKPSKAGGLPAGILAAQAAAARSTEETRPHIAPAAVIPPTVVTPAVVTAIAGVRLTGPSGNFKTTLGTCVVGRGDEAGIRINSKEMSRRHALLVIKPNAITVEDLTSANGTRVNGEKISAPTPLAHGDTVAFSGFKFEVEVIRLDH